MVYGGPEVDRRWKKWNLAFSWKNGPQCKLYNGPCQFQSLENLMKVACDFGKFRAKSLVTSSKLVWIGFTNIEKLFFTYTKNLRFWYRLEVSSTYRNSLENIEPFWGVIDTNWIKTNNFIDQSKHFTSKLQRHRDSLETCSILVSEHRWKWDEFCEITRIPLNFCDWIVFNEQLGL